MKIALDYDETYTKDPAFWDLFITNCKWMDHEVFIVTFRGTDTPIERDPGIPVYYTDRVAKRPFMESFGIKIDVWIDDLPELIVNESDWTPEQVADWKATL